MDLNQVTKLLKPYWQMLILGVAVASFCLSVFRLTALPVFADESIYIRWAQLILDDPGRYAFFALNDGKTPLFIWSMVPSLLLFQDQLFAGRLIMALIAPLQVVAMAWFTHLIFKSKRATLLAAGLTAILPFWFFHFRVALMDGMMTLFATLALCFLLILLKRIEKKSSAVLPVVAAGGFFGLSLLSKLPALFFIPHFMFAVFFPAQKMNANTLMKRVILIGITGLIGCLIFLSLKLHPAFPQLFSRSGDFTYSAQDVISGEWKTTFNHMPIFLAWLASYVTIGGLLVIVKTFVFPKNRWTKLWLLCAALGFCLPFLVFGKTVYPRYLLPSMIFLTPLIAQGLSELLQIKQKMYQLAGVILLGAIVLQSLRFILPNYFDPDHIPFVDSDQMQYLDEWSSGHGILEAVEFVSQQSQLGRTVVATEGYFGTLPDAMLMNLHNRSLPNLEVFGIGQPIGDLPEEFIDKATAADYAYVVVNSHRMNSTDPRLHLVKEFKRPGDAPTLQIYEFIP